MGEDESNRWPADFAPVIPAFGFLSNDPDLPADTAAREALAAASYWLKDGRSVAMTIPRAGREALVTAVQYIRRMRMDALVGTLRSAWFSRGSMHQRQALIVFGKPRFAISCLAGQTGLQPQLIRSRDLENRPPQTPRVVTLSEPMPVWICGAGDDNLTLMSALENKSNPLGIVIDATPSGCRDVLPALLDCLVSYFPDTPKLLITSAGDLWTLQSVPSAVSGHFIHWSQRNQSPATRGHASSWRVTLVTSPDQTLPDRLRAIEGNIRALRQQLSQLPRSRQTSLLQPVYRLLGYLHPLACPIDELESALTTHQRGGPFPIKTCAQWLGLLRQSDAGSGSAQSTLDAIGKQFTDLLQDLKKAETGKQQLVSALIIQCPGSIVIVVDTDPQAEALKDSLSTRGLAVGDVVSVKQLQNYPRPIPVLLCLIQWWPDRYWILGAAPDVRVVAYTAEQESLRQKLDSPLRKSLLTPQQRRAWKQWWYQPLTGWDFDGADELPKELLAVTTATACRGKYPQSHTTVVNLPEVAWLMSLFEDERLVRSAQPSNTGDESVVDGQERVRLFLAHDNRPLIVKPQQLVDVLRSGKLESLMAGEVKAGDEVLIFPEGDRQDTLNTLMGLLDSQSATLGQVQWWAQRWHEWVRLANRKPDAIQNGLLRTETVVTKATIQRWIARAGIGPQKEHIVDLIAELSGQPGAREASKPCWEAIRRLRGLRIQLGKQINAWIRARATGESHLHIGSLRVDTATLEQLVVVDEVVRVDSPFTGRRESGQRSLLEALIAVSDEYPDRLDYTSKARRKTEKAGYLNIDKAVTCFRLLATELVDAYRGKKRLGDVIEILKSEQIEFAGNTAESTKGLSSEYKATYKGKVWDLGAHVKLGSTRNPAHCFRIHFAYDTDDQVLLILHAGNHLPVKSS